MGLTENYSMLTLVLVSSLAVLAAVWISFCSLRRYEIAIALMLLSPWAGWIFLPNVERSVKELTAVGPGTYLRIGTVALVGIMGILQLIRLRPISRGKVPSHLVLLGILI